MPPAARMGDQVIQDGPHCHLPTHPVPGGVAPIPHPPLPLALAGNAVMTVLIGGAPAAVVGTITAPCALPGCTPNGPGQVQMGSTSTLIGGRPAARVGDMCAFTGCVAPVPMPTGKILPPGCPTVLIN